MEVIQGEDIMNCLFQLFYSSYMYIFFHVLKEETDTPWKAKDYSSSSMIYKPH